MLNVLSHAAIVVTWIVCLAFAQIAYAEDAGPVRQSPGPATDLTTREGLADAGFQFSAVYIGEALGSVSGGVRNGIIYTGRLDLGTTIDLEKVAGWTGA